MAHFINTVTLEYPVYRARILKDNPTVSFPKGFSSYGDFALVQDTAKPVGDVVTEGAPILVGDTYTQSWEVREFNEFELASIATGKMAAIETAVQTHLDAQAKTMGYDSIHTGVTYADEVAVAEFQAEGQALRAWRSNVWAAVYTLLAEYQAGARAEMTPEEVVALLPAYGG